MAMAFVWVWVTQTTVVSPEVAASTAELPEAVVPTLFPESVSESALFPELIIERSLVPEPISEPAPVPEPALESAPVPESAPVTPEVATFVAEPLMAVMFTSALPKTAAALSPKLSVFPDASVTTARAASELSVFFEAPAANPLEMATSAAEPLEVVASAAEPVGFRTCCRTCRWQGCSLQLLLRHVTNELLVCSDQGYYSFEFLY